MPKGFFFSFLFVTGGKQVDFDPTETESGMVLETLLRRETKKRHTPLLFHLSNMENQFTWGM